MINCQMNETRVSALEVQGLPRPSASSIVAFAKPQDQSAKRELLIRAVLYSNIGPHDGSLSGEQVQS